MTKHLCETCNKPINWKEKTFLYRLDVDDIIGNNEKIYFHKRCENTWKIVNWLRKQKRRVKVIDRKFINRRKQLRKKNKPIRTSRNCSCPECV